MSSTFSSFCFLFLIFLVFDANCARILARNGTHARSTINIELFYSATSQKDGDFVVSQLAPELQDPFYPNLFVIALASGGLSLAENGSCQDAENGNLCATGLLHVSLFVLTNFCLFTNVLFNL